MINGIIDEPNRPVAEFTAKAIDLISVEYDSDVKGYNI
jgi:hypothetical protein